MLMPRKTRHRKVPEASVRSLRIAASSEPGPERPGSEAAKSGEYTASC